MAKDCAECGLAACGLEPASLAVSRPRTPLEPHFRRQIRNLRERRRRTHPSTASGVNLEAAPGPAQFH
eukprot:7627668-Alexandrium_andersonii.AAC.1